MPCRCCTNTLLIGCLSNCANLIIDISGTIAGDIFNLFVDFAGKEKNLQSVILNNGDKPTFNLADLNESYSFVGTLYKDGAPVILVDAANNQYDCLKFSTRYADTAINLISQPLTIL